MKSENLSMKIPKMIYTLNIMLNKNIQQTF